MSAREVEERVKNWLSSEGLEIKEKEDPRANFHFLVRYPPTKHGHLFNVLSPKNRNLLVISSVTQVDSGQQNEMSTHTNSDSDGWEEWLHETRLQLTRSNVDWVLHVGHGKEGPGPLQAFNLSLPIWFDGVTQNEVMQSLRRLWLSKLSVIHEIKFSYGPGVGKPGPVDDWEKAGNQPPSQPSPSTEKVETDETGGFGTGFDPSEWV
ncbi:MAG: DUF2299 family protein [Candidatus Thermoplasmatota archaeon]|nr:DUF2299 family protein [Candidatus Thermoplasmatota archaeon]MED5487246.1 DUF2299 family protein [Candidatus Thermoplasmatota archaeon]|tara:strand:- start:1078 stop:1698 length:621 start_codon:yes stop_codon:yes gene_type:complete